MEIIDGHSHLFQPFAPSDDLKTDIGETFKSGIESLFNRLDEMGVTCIQIMPQEMTRIQGRWLGSNELAADIQELKPNRIIAFAAAEPLDSQGKFNKKRLEEVERMVTDRNLKGLLLTPPYGHYYSNDRRVYPFYEKATELDIPIYFHHSHQFGPPEECPLKYARIWHLDDVIADFPDLKINVEHMGYPWTEELLSMMSRSPNVYTDTAMYIANPLAQDRRLLLARNLGMAREYGVLDRVFIGSDYFMQEFIEKPIEESIEKYINQLQRIVSYIKEELNDDMERQGFQPLTQKEMEGLLSNNVRDLWRGRKS